MRGNLKKVADAVVALGKLSLRFGRTNRITLHEDGVMPESDTDHTVMLGLVACAYAAREAPHLDLGKIAQFALVHDLVEVYAGDTNTLKRMSTQDMSEKKKREHAALTRIRREFKMTLPWLHETIEEYDSLATPEARFVKTMDKGMPSITHTENEGVLIRKHGFTKETLVQHNRERRAERLRTFAKDQPEALALLDELAERARQAFKE